MMTDTLQQLERTREEAIDVTSRAWRAAFAAQLTQALTDDVHAYAVSRAKWVHRHSATVDPRLADELTQDALGDTFLGVVVWNPAKEPLALHLKGVIRGRTARLLEHEARFPGKQLTADNVDLEREVSEALAGERSNSVEDLTAHVDRTIRELRSLAEGDGDVLALLDAYGQGAIDRRDVMRVTGMTAKKYHNAVRRMLRLVERLPTEVRQAAINALA